MIETQESTDMNWLNGEGQYCVKSVSVCSSADVYLPIAQSHSLS